MYDEEEEEQQQDSGFDVGPAGGFSEESASDQGGFSAQSEPAAAPAPEPEAEPTFDVGTPTNADDAGLSGVPEPAPAQTPGTSTSVENIMGDVNAPVAQPAGVPAAAPVAPVVEEKPRDWGSSVIAGFVNPEMTADPAAVKAAQDAFAGFYNEALQQYSPMGFSTPMEYMQQRGNYASGWLDSVVALARGQLVGGYKGQNWEPHVGWGFNAPRGAPAQRGPAAAAQAASQPAAQGPMRGTVSLVENKYPEPGPGVYARTANWQDRSMPSALDRGLEQYGGPMTQPQQSFRGNEPMPLAPRGPSTRDEAQSFMLPANVLDLERARALRGG